MKFLLALCVIALGASVSGQDWWQGMQSSQSSQPSSNNNYNQQWNNQNNNRQVSNNNSNNNQWSNSNNQQATNTQNNNVNNNQRNNQQWSNQSNNQQNNQQWSSQSNNQQNNQQRSNQGSSQQNNQQWSNQNTNQQNNQQWSNQSNNQQNNQSSNNQQRSSQNTNQQNNQQWSNQSNNQQNNQSSNNQQKPQNNNNQQSNQSSHQSHQSNHQTHQAAQPSHSAQHSSQSKTAGPSHNAQHQQGQPPQSQHGHSSQQGFYAQPGGQHYSGQHPSQQSCRSTPYSCDENQYCPPNKGNPMCGMMDDGRTTDFETNCHYDKHIRCKAGFDKVVATKCPDCKGTCQEGAQPVCAHKPEGFYETMECADAFAARSICKPDEYTHMTEGACNSQKAAPAADCKRKDRSCKQDHKPMCATMSNNRTKTFYNTCDMEDYFRCKPTTLVKLVKGYCPHAEDPCKPYCSNSHNQQRGGQSSHQAMTFQAQPGHNGQYGSYAPKCGFAADGEMENFDDKCQLEAWEKCYPNSFKKVTDGRCPSAEQKCYMDADEECGTEYKPVCASKDNKIFKTFKNQCQYEKLSVCLADAHYEEQTPYTKVEQGSCESTISPNPWTEPECAAEERPQPRCVTHPDGVSIELPSLCAYEAYKKINKYTVGPAGYSRCDDRVQRPGCLSTCEKKGELVCGFSDEGKMTFNSECEYELYSKGAPNPQQQGNNRQQQGHANGQPQPPQYHGQQWGGYSGNVNCGGSYSGFNKVLKGACEEHKEENNGRRGQQGYGGQHYHYQNQQHSGNVPH